MAEKFKIAKSSDDKEWYISGPCELSITIDHDDVDHETVEKETRKLVRLLNKYWDSDNCV